LVFGVVVIGALAEVMSKTLDLGLEGTGAPPVITAILVAAISAAPEILTALRAALANRMQSVVNIAMGASLSTVILTVPVMEAMALYTGQPFQMAMTPVQTVMIFITLIVSAINLNDGETNAIEGMTHLCCLRPLSCCRCWGVSGSSTSRKRCLDQVPAINCRAAWL
jgi:Ca2+:H+ antiporter